ncbi:TrmH family RNA methyltransferase [Candidatus Saccharibacteria bacterium]|nr:TrmH family RNA methyltransferase [Candidatus Saccharibacteria bacterium]
MIIILHNIRSTYNVGAILRTAEGFGVEKVIFSGYTPRVHDQNLLPHLRDKLDREIHKTALGAEDMLDIYSSDDIFKEAQKLRDKGYQMIGLENNTTASPLYQLNDSALFKALKSNFALILGEEVNGIDYSLYDIIDLFIEIPMHGQKESFNVSVAAGIAMYALTNLQPE